VIQQQDKREEMMGQEDKGLDGDMEVEGEFLEELSLGKIVVDMDSMEVKSLKFSRKFHQLFGKDGLARADILKDISCLVEDFRESSVNEYFLEAENSENDSEEIWDGSPPIRVGKGARSTFICNRPIWSPPNLRLVIQRGPEATMECQKKGGTHDHKTGS